MTFPTVGGNRLARPLRSARPRAQSAHHRRRLRFDPPFYASWDTKPRTFWDAAIVAVHTDLGVTGYGSGDMMLDSSGMIVLSDRPGMGYERNIDALASTRVT